MNDRRLYRSQDRMIAGVAGGVADYFDLDPSLVRIIWAISMPFSGFATLLIYIVMAIVVPEEPDEWAYGPAPAGPLPPAPPVPPVPPMAAGAGESPEGSAEGSAAPAEQATAAGGPWTSSAGTTPGGPAATGPGWTDWRSAPREDRWARRQERWERRMDRLERRHRDGTGGLIFGLLLVVIGAAFLANQLVPGIDFNQVWPIAVIAIGVVFLVGSVTGRDQS